MIDLLLRFWDEMSLMSQVLWVLSFSLIVLGVVAFFIFVSYRILKPKKQAIIYPWNMSDPKPVPHEDDSGSMLSVVKLRLWRVLEGLSRDQRTLLALFLVLSLSLLSVTAIWSIWDVTILREAGVTAKRIGGGSTVIGSEGRDKQGKSATSEIIVLSREYFWVYGSSTVVMNTAGDPVDIEEKLRGQGIQKRFQTMTDLVAVGTASCIGGTDEEAGRALERANTMMGWLRASTVAARIERLYILNLGKYSLGCEHGRGERFQRAVIIVGVTGKQPGVSIEESFRDALYRARRKVFISIDVEGYSNWSADRFALTDVT